MVVWLRELKEGQGEISWGRGGEREVEGSRDWSAQALQGEEERGVSERGREGREEDWRRVIGRRKNIRGNKGRKGG